MVFLQEIFEKVDFEKNQQKTKKKEKLPRRQRAKHTQRFLLVVNIHCTDHTCFFHALIFAGSRVNCLNKTSHVCVQMAYWGQGKR